MTTKVRNQLLYGQDEFVAAWVNERLEGGQITGPYTGIGVMSDDSTRLIAGFVFHNYRDVYRTMELGLAAVSSMWARPETMLALFHYPFIIAEVNKLWVSIERTSKKAIKTAEHAGFKPEAVLADEFGPKRHAVRLRMLRREFDKIYGNKENVL